MAKWAGRRSGWLAQSGRYAAHDQIGAGLLEAAGSDPMVVAWAREHHLPKDSWSIDPAMGSVLKAADED
jgi:hypothetical protein